MVKIRINILLKSTLVVIIFILFYLNNLIPELKNEVLMQPLLIQPLLMQPRILNSDSHNTKIIYSSKCECQLEEIRFEKSGLNIRISNGNENIQEFTESQFKNLNFTCDIYNTFKRNESQLKVVAFSLYGNLEKYNKDMKLIANAVQKFYPDWIMRVYHDKLV